MVEYKDRLAQALTSANASVRLLADEIGISYQAVKKVVDGKSSAFSAANNSKVANFLGVNSHWLATGEGTKQINSIANSNVSPGPDIRGRVPLISWIQAGAWCKAEDLLQVGEAERWFDCPVNHSASTFTLRVRGDSMTAAHGNSRTYPEGCFIFVDPEKRSPNNGDRVVACLEGSDDVTFKVYKNEDGRQWLQPLNPSHEPIREKFKILGTVLGKWEDG